MNNREKFIADAKARADRNRALEDLRWVMSEPQGRRVLWDLIERGRVFQKCYAGKNGDTDYLLGRKEIMLELLNDLLTACPNAISLMQADRKPGETHG